MPRRWISVAKLPAGEQRAIGSLRGDDRYEFGRDAKNEFRQLRQAAQGVGMYIPTRQSPYLTVDEAGLLKRLRFVVYSTAPEVPAKLGLAQ